MANDGFCCSHEESMKDLVFIIVSSGPIVILTPGIGIRTGIRASLGVVVVLVVAATVTIAVAVAGALAAPVTTD